MLCDYWSMVDCISCGALWVWGWHICQECCPFNMDMEEGRGNRRDGGGDVPLPSEERAAVGRLGGGQINGASPTAEPVFQPRDVTVNSTVEDILPLNEERFRVQFPRSAVKRAKWKGLRRNASVARNATRSDGYRPLSIPDTSFSGRKCGHQKAPDEVGCFFTPVHIGLDLTLALGDRGLTGFEC